MDAPEQCPCAECCWSSGVQRAKGSGIRDHHPQCGPQTVMKPLELHDQRHLEAAQGWFELGNCIEATEELDQITPEMRGHPSVLEVRFHIYAAAEKWEYAAEIAKAISEFAPESPFGFIHLAYSLQAALAEADLIALGDRYVRELRASPRAHVDFGAGAGGQLAVAGDEIGMQVG